MNKFILLTLLISCSPKAREEIKKQTIVDTVLAIRKANWNWGAFKDEFGDQTRDRYIKTNIEGTFSNSATTDAPLYVEILFTKKSAVIFLHQYLRNNPSEKFIGTGEIRVKNSKDRIISFHSFRSWNQNGGLAIEDDYSEDLKVFLTTDFSKFKSFLLQSQGEIKFAIRDKYSSSYLFVLNVDGFKDEFDKL